MNSDQNIFIVKQVSFVQGERDPFGFDNFSRKLGENYLPFSGTVAKPSYFLFVAYVKNILREYYQNKSQKQKEEIKNRLEKLLVYSWKHKANNTVENNSNNLRGHSIIGNSKIKVEIDLSTGNRIVKQNCFAIYTDGDNKFMPKSTLHKYLTKMNNEIYLLKEFIDNPKAYKKEKKGDTKKVDILLKKLQVSNSLFNNHLLTGTLKTEFKNELKEAISKKSEHLYFQIIDKHFKRNGFEADSFLKDILENKSLPFFELNIWFSKFVEAVEADLMNDKECVIKWKEVEKIDNIIKKYKIKVEQDFKFKANSKWFDHDNNQYSFKKSFTQSELSNFRDSWDKYKSRVNELAEAKEDDSINDFIKKYFFNYRHYAFKRLLKELR
ncbi:MAG: hypothetical protein Q8M15_08490 [Bacteroidota bacterium]|nr:hypothetical protein [Bacteroidota bacterium]